MYFWGEGCLHKQRSLAFSCAYVAVIHIYMNVVKCGTCQYEGDTCKRRRVGFAR